MPLVISGISALAAFLLRETGLFWIAVVNTVVCFASLGVLSNFAGAPVSGNFERVVGLVSIVTSLAGVVLLITAFFI